MYYDVKGTNVRLLGSLHVVPANRADMPYFVDRGYAWCKRLVFEMDTASLDLQWLLNLPNGQQLDERVPAPLLKRIRAVWPTNHPFGMLRNQNLWLLAFRIPLLNMSVAPGLAIGVEGILTGQSKADNKPVEYLETPAEFAELASGITDAQYFELFDAMLAQLPQSAGRILATHDAWMAGDPHRVDQSLEYSRQIISPAISNALLVRRNAAWLPRILKLTELPESTLVAVGCAHLPSEHGLISMLGQHGYEVVPAA